MHKLQGIIKYDNKFYLTKLSVEMFYSKTSEKEIDKTVNRVYSLRDAKIAPMKLPGLNPGSDLFRTGKDTSLGANISIAQLHKIVKDIDEKFFENPDAVGRAKRENKNRLTNMFNWLTIFGT